MDTHTLIHIHAVIQQTVSAYPIPTTTLGTGPLPSWSLPSHTHIHVFTGTHMHTQTHSHTHKHTDKSRINMPDKPRNPRFCSGSTHSHEHTLYNITTKRRHQPEGRRRTNQLSSSALILKTRSILAQLGFSAQDCCS